MADATSLLSQYTTAIATKYSHPETSEMGYRTDFEILLKGIFSSINVSRFDHDAKAKQGNKPDFVVVKDDVPLLYIETKDIGVSLDKVEKSEQMTRYFGYDNLVLTDYTEFRFYRYGVAYGDSLKIAEYDTKQRTITPLPENYQNLARTLIDFTQSHKEPIKSSKHLAKIMGQKGQRIRDNLRVIVDARRESDSELLNVYETIKRLLVHDLTIESFADMYAQTLVYGLFVARFYDDSLGTFTRQEARDLIPASNPFLGHFFDHIAGRNFEKRLSYIVDELCEVFTHANVAELMRQHFETTSKKGTQRGQDQVIHFYEDFLKEYDDVLRKKMGAYYTPLPVVQFIVRSVDYLLEKEFGLTEGLASTEMTHYEIDTGQDLRADRRTQRNTKIQTETPRVQILDPAVGTATFLNEIIEYIYTSFGGQAGRWPSYVYDNLLKRLYGFELMMTAYTIAHLKLSMTLRETGITDLKQRVGVYLTNTLEEGVKIPSDLFSFGLAESITEEAKEAAKIKNEKPIMVVIGNPPYSVSSSNKGVWITDLTKDYKENLNERNIQPLSDDYIKFIRFAEHFIEKNGSGIVAMITNNSFLDGIIHRQMRKHLLETFDNIYILDLHGNSKKKEAAPDGSKDENVFDIQQGVSINIFVRKEREKSGLGVVHHSDLYGKRTNKFEALSKNDFEHIKWNTLISLEPYYYFIPKDFELEEEYMLGFSINKVFKEKNTGFETGRDALFIDFSIYGLGNKIEKVLNNKNSITTLEAYKIKNTKDFRLLDSINTIEFDTQKIALGTYRPFDERAVYYEPTMLRRPSYEVNKHLQKENLALISCRQQTTFEFQHVFVSQAITERCSVSLQTGEVGYVFPLYLYSEDGTKIPNLKPEIVGEIEGIVGGTSPEDIFDYIYAVLHSPTYRERYKEFLKIDFPRVPYPKDKATFKKLVKLGTELRQLHLLETPKVNKFITTYPVTGTDLVEKITYLESNVYINDSQYFGRVPDIAWNFWIGGYQPAQKWLKDRKGRQLSNEDIEHYQQMIVALTETDRLMKEIDKI